MPLYGDPLNPDIPFQTGGLSGFDLNRLMEPLDPAAADLFNSIVTTNWQGKTFNTNIEPYIIENLGSGFNNPGFQANVIDWGGGTSFPVPAYMFNEALGLYDSGMASPVVGTADVISPLLVSSGQGTSNAFDASIIGDWSNPTLAEAQAIMRHTPGAPGDTTMGGVPVANEPISFTGQEEWMAQNAPGTNYQDYLNQAIAPTPTGDVYSGDPYFGGTSPGGIVPGDTTFSRDQGGTSFPAFSLAGGDLAPNGGASFATNPFPSMDFATTGGTTGGADQYLASLAPNIGFLENYATQAGLPSTPTSFNDFMAMTGGTMNPLTGMAGSPMFADPTTAAQYSAMRGGMLNPLMGLQNPQFSEAVTPGLYGGLRGGLLQNLQQFGESGLPVSSLPAWDAMVEAQQRNIDRRAADISEQFNVGGNRFSSVFGDAMTDFYSQTAKDQNALLAQMQMSALENARQRQYGAAGQLGGFGQAQAQQIANQLFGAQESGFGRQLQAAQQLGLISQAQAEQLASQAYGAQEAGLQRQLGAAQTLAPLGLNIGSQLAQQQFGAQESAAQRQLQASQQLASLASQAGQQLSAQEFQSLMNQMDQSYGMASQMLGLGGAGAQQMASLGATGAQGLMDAAMTGAQGLFGAENQAALAEAQRMLQATQLGLGTAGQLSDLYRRSLQAGSLLGQQQWDIGQGYLDRTYNEWLRQQPEYNPLLPYMYGGATGFTPLYAPQYRPPAFPQYMSAAGGLLGALGQFRELF